ncbi:MAG TPA: hypothetical protein VGS80_22930 [Ktedonobacterales bacterium]|nr:hypothetical protein [Ktedonobacterales bacterium]
MVAGDARIHCRRAVLAREHQVVVLPEARAPFAVCISSYTTGAPTPNALACSTDGGVSWHARPPLFRASSMLVVGIASDRAILASDAGDTLYRLANGASQWQPLGPLPQRAVTFVRAPGAGTLWAYPGPWLAPQQRLFTASYS